MNMKKLPKAHVWLCEPCGASVHNGFRDKVTLHDCLHTQERKDRSEAERLWPHIVDLWAEKKGWNY